MCVRHTIAFLCPLIAFALIGAAPDTPIRVRPSDWGTRLSSPTLAACEPKRTDFDLSGNVSLTCKVTSNGTLESCAGSGDAAQREWALCLSRNLRVKRHLAGKTVEVPFRLKYAAE